MAQDPNVEQPENEDNDKALPKSEQILADREQWLQIKKSLDAIMPLADQVCRLKALGNKPNKLKNTKKKRNKQIKDFRKKLGKLPKDNEMVIDGKKWAKKLEGKDPDVQNEDNAEEDVDTLTQERLAGYQFDIRKYTSSIEKIRRELLAEYKKAKAEEDPEYGKPQKGDDEEENQ